MSNKYLLDSYAWIEYFLATQSGEVVRTILEDEDNLCFISVLSLTEVVIKLKKLNLDWTSALSSMKSLSSSLPIDSDTSIEAAHLYLEKRKLFRDIGIVDVIIMVQARREHLTIVTGDTDHFKGEKNTIFLK
jgi:predicted nucleic acid-binding protein